MSKMFAKAVYRTMDALLVRSDFPILGKPAKAIRVFLARRISKGIDKKAFIDKKATISEDVTVHKNGCIGKRCLLTPHVTIGEDTMMGPEVLFFTKNHKRDDNAPKFADGYEETRPIVVGNNCWIGQRVIILGGVHIGNYVTIGAGSVVTKDVPDGCLVAGNPATIKKRYLQDGDAK